MAKKIGKFIYPAFGTQADAIAEALKKMGMETAAASYTFIAEKVRSEHGTHQDFLDQLLRLEYEAKEEARVNRSINRAKLGPVKTIAEYKFKEQPNVDPVLVHELAICRFITEGKNVIFLGPPGVGKTHLATALGHEAIVQGLEVRVVRVNEFQGAMEKSSDNSLRQLQDSLQKPQLVILDDIDYFKYDEQSCNFYFSIVKDRYENRRSTIITSNRDPYQWENVFGKRGAAALIDRMFDHQRTVVINISGGRSYRVPQPLSIMHGNQQPVAVDTKDEGLLKKIGAAFAHKT